MKSLISFASVLFSVALACGSASWADEPVKLGYERWSNDNIDSGTLFGWDPESLLGLYADKWTIAGPAPTPCGKRLIDIEIYYDKTLKKNLCNAIWVRNEDNFKTKSYLIHNVSHDDVHKIASLRDFLILDIESYDHSPFNTGYTVIVRSNPLRFKTKVLTSVSYDELQQHLENRYWRPIDIDMHQAAGEYVKMPSNYDETMNFYDAVFVSTEQLANQLPTYVAFGNQTDINNANLYGQVIDVEATGNHFQHYHPNWQFMYIVVEAGSAFTFAKEMTPSSAVASQHDILYFYDVEDASKRCVDIQGFHFNPDFNPDGHFGIFKNK